MLQRIGPEITINMGFTEDGEGGHLPPRELQLTFVFMFLLFAKNTGI